MKSSIKVDFCSPYKSAGMEPVIIVNLSKDTQDVRDKLLSEFFQKLCHQSKWLFVNFHGTDDGYSKIHIHPVIPSDNLRHIADMAVCDQRPFAIVEGQRLPNRVDLLPPSEKAIHESIQEIEKLPAHPILTDLQTILSYAQGVLYDFNVLRKPESNNKLA